jgi:lipopolysaccharide biosynthesis glycosyltransferase
MIRVFIGTEPMQWLPTEVLKHSIIKRTQTPVQFQELKDIPLKLKIKMYTGFSFYRYYIPEACNYQGRAIYLDADMVCLQDIAQLFELDMQDKGALAKVQNETSFFTSNMLLDCEKLKHWKVHEWVTLINAGLTSYRGCMSGDPTGMNHNDFGPLPDRWNEFDFYDENTKLIHYTNVPTQPWKKPGHPYRGAFLSELKASLADHTIKKEDIEREIVEHHIYPTILQDMEEYVATAKKNSF